MVLYIYIMRLLRFFVCWIVFSILPSWSVGFGFEYASAKVSAHGNTGVVNLGSASAVHYNPGALSFLECSQVEANSFVILADSKWSQNGVSYNADDDAKYSASMYYAHLVNWSAGQGVFGLGLSHSYGQKISWDSANPTRVTGYEGDLNMHQYQISYAHKFSDTLGAGITWNWVESELDSKAGVVLPSDVGHFNGTGASNFFQFGVYYQPVTDWSVGVAYRSAFDVNHDGDYKYTSNFPLVPDAHFSAESDLDLPSHIIMGLSYTGIDRLTLSWQSHWTEWSVVKDFSVKVQGQENVLPVNWKDGWIHSLGASYQLNEKVVIHAGYMYIQSIIPDRTETLLHPDFDQHFLSTGVSYATDKWGVDFTLIYTHSEDYQIDNSLYGVNGDHEASGFMVNLGGHWKY